MSLGDHIPLLGGSGSDLADDREAGIFSTISVPTPTSRIDEPASSASDRPLLGGLIDSIIPGGSSSVGVSVISGIGGGGTSGSVPTDVAGSSTIISALAPPVSTTESVSIRPDPLTIFTTIPASSTIGNSPRPLATSGPENMINNHNILLPANKLFPLGITVVILGGLSILGLAALLLYKCTKQRRQRKLGDRILSFSPDMTDAPYPFDTKAYDDDLESRYPSMPHGVGDDNEPQSSPPPSLAPIGIASSFPGQFDPPRSRSDGRTPGGYYTETTRAGPVHDRPDTFTCAMFPAGTCPIEHEVSSANDTIDRPGAGSPVPSFHTGRLDGPHPTITSHRQHERTGSGKLLTPPQPIYKSKHIPAPLMISPSINEGTNSIRGFTPRKSIVSVGSAYGGI